MEAARGAAVAAKAGGQWGVLRGVDLAECGLTRAAVGRWVTAGRLHRLHRGVYSIAPAAALTQAGRDLAAVWGAGTGAVLCRVSAGVRWGMLRFGPAMPQVLVLSTGRRPFAGVELHVSAELPAVDVTVRDRVPLTTPERTLIDLASCAELSDRALESAAAQAEADGWLRRPAQLRVAHRARHRAGSERLRHVLRVGPRLWRSDEEAAAAVALVEAGLPEPRIAHVIRTDRRPYEADLALAAERLILEVDGDQHTHRLAAARDVDRDAALARAGWRTVRVPAAAIRADPTVAVRAVRGALGRESSSTPSAGG